MNESKYNRLYECRFIHRKTEKITHANRLCDLTEGFWISEKWELTKGGDARFFIMPHMIVEIEAVLIRSDNGE